MARLLWIGKESPVVGLLNRNGYHVNVAVGVEDAVGDLRASPPDLVILDKNSCVQGELAAVRLKSAAPKVPIFAHLRAARIRCSASVLREHDTEFRDQS